MKSVKVYVDKYVKQNKIKEIRRNIAKIRFFENVIYYEKRKILF